MDLAKDSFESLKQRVWGALKEALGDDVYGYDIVHTFPSSCIVRDYNSSQFYKVEFEDGENGTVLKGIEEVDEAYVVTAVVEATGATKAAVETSLKGLKSAHLTAPIVSKSEDSEKRIAYGPVLVPDEPDSDGDVVTREKIEEVAHKFLRDYGNIDLQHTLNVVARPVESYITKSELVFGDVTVPEGSWMMGVYVEDDATWEAVKSGDIGGFSIMGVRKATADEVVKSGGSLDAAALKRTTLADLGEDWVCNFVSLVDTPAVPKAKFVMVKSAKKGNVVEQLMARLSNLGKAKQEPTEKAGRRFSKATYDTLTVAAEALAKLVEEAAKEHETETAAEKQDGREDVDETKVQEMIAEAVEPIAKAVKGIGESIAKLTAPKSEEAPATEAPATTEAPAAKSDEAPAEGEDVEALKSRITELETENAGLSEFKETVEKRFGGSAAAKGLKGQDGTETEPPATKGSDLEGRDAYGRRVRS